jgi:GT2 family glycosyltransferase
MYNSDLEKLSFVSIVVLNYNGKAFLDACLSSVFQISYPRSSYEVILVDNASTDGSVEYVRDNYPSIRILALNKNYGYAEGNNKGAEFAHGDLIVFLNNDTIVDKNWLFELVKVTFSDLRIGMCGSKVVSIKGNNVVQYNGQHLHVLGGVIPGDFYTYKNELGKEFHAVGSINGSSFLVRKDVFKSLGGFDKDYFLYSDEVDICYRTWINGYYVAYASNSMVYHYGGGTAGTLNRHKFSILLNRLKSPLRIYYGNRNSIINIVKNLELRNMLIGIAFSFPVFFFQLFILLKDKDAQNAKLLIRSYTWPIVNLKVNWRKRSIVQANRKVADEELIRKGILLPITKLLRIAKIEFFSKRGD